MKSSHSYFLLGLPAVLVVGIGWFTFCMFHDTSSQGLESKSEWGALQNSEYDLRSKPVMEATIANFGERALLEIPGAQASGSGVVVLLKAKAEPYYKQMPAGSYRLTQADFVKVKASGLASETVLAVLSSHTDPK